MKNLKISVRTLLISLVALTGFAAIAGVTVWSGWTQSHNAELQRLAAEKFALVQQVSLDFLNARRREKDFLLRLEADYAKKHGTVSEKVRGDLGALKALAAGDQVTLTGQLADQYSAYEKQFAVVVAQWTEMGLDEKSGLQGQLRGAVHKAEEAIKTSATDDLMVKLLMMRRHEKDFILRKDPKYVGQLGERIVEFKALIESKDVEASAKSNILGSLDAYQNTFKAYSSLMLGIEQETERLSALYTAAEPTLKKLLEGIDAEYTRVTAALKTANDEAYYVTLGLILAIAVMSILVSLYVGRSVSVPIGRLSQLMLRLSQGDKTIEVDTSGRDEVAEMARAVQVFKDNLIRTDQMQAEAQAKQEAELARARRMTAITTEFDGEAKALIDDLITAASQLQATSSEMTSVAEDSGQRAGAVASATQETTANVQTVATATTELSASISEIASQVSNATAVAGDTARQASETSVVMDELSETVGRIGEIVTLIRAIAEQTNLLALNATIESARAGDAGKGFAVVASEVKNLAGQTGKATEEISAQIEAIQSRTAGAVEAIKAIVGKVGEMEGITAAVAAAIEEQNAATQEISRNIEDVAAAADEVGKNVDYVSDSAQKTGRMAGDVLQASNQVNVQSSRLSDRVGGFLSSVRSV